jgi:hypothetical protein
MSTYLAAPLNCVAFYKQSVLSVKFVANLGLGSSVCLL